MNGKRFNYTAEKIGQHWGMEITDNQTKQPFDVDYIEINDNYSQTKDNVNFIVYLLNELHEENEKLHDEIFRLRTELAFNRTEKEEHSYSVYDFQKKLEKW